MASIESSIKFLQMLGALDDRENLTALGRVLSNLPIDVILGKMLVMATVIDNFVYDTSIEIQCQL